MSAYTISLFLFFGSECIASIFATRQGCFLWWHPSDRRVTRVAVLAGGEAQEEIQRKGLTTFALCPGRLRKWLWRPGRLLHRSSLRPPYHHQICFKHVLFNHLAQATYIVGGGKGNFLLPEVMKQGQERGGAGVHPPIFRLLLDVCTPADTERSSKGLTGRWNGREGT